MESVRRIKGYPEFIKSIRMNESLSGVPANGQFSPYTKVMLNWCGFEPSESSAEIYNLGIRGKDLDGEYNLFTSVAPEDGGAKCVFVILVQGDYLKDLIRGSQKKIFRGPKSKMLGDILLRLRKSSGGDYQESFVSKDKDDDLKIYGSEKAADDKWYRFIYKTDIKDLIEIMPIWSDFMSYIGYAPKSEMKSNKLEEGKYFGSSIMGDFIEQFKLANPKIKRLEVIFPETWDEYAALQWAKEFGLLAPVFRSIKEGTEYLKSFDGFKFDEIVVGSHGSDTGSYTQMVRSIEDPDDSDLLIGEVRGFLEQLAKITDLDSKVYFTSCYAGSNRKKLVNVAEIIGCTVYGSEGVNYLGFKSESDKFWMAKPDGTFEVTGNKPPFVMDFGAGSFLNGVSMVAQSMTLEQINKIKDFGKSVSAEWGKFEKDPWGYATSSCTDYIEKKVESFKKNAEGLYNQTGKALSDMWNSW
jgi:hypothetical protein